MIERCITAEELTAYRGVSLKKMLIIEKRMVLDNGRIVFLCPQIVLGII